MNNEKILEKEIDLIQNCITRMGQNSFSVKGVFWILDAFYLKTEKLYRWKYDWVIKKRKETLDFCYDLNPYKKEMWLLNEDGTSKKEPSIIRIMFTKTLWPFYLPIILIALAILVKCVVK